MTMQQIIERTASMFGLETRDLTGESRTKHIAAARQAAYLLARELMPWASCQDIGRAFRRDHTTVIHGIEAARVRGRSEPAYQQLVLRVRAELEML